MQNHRSNKDFRQMDASGVPGQAPDLSIMLAALAGRQTLDRHVLQNPRTLGSVTSSSALLAALSSSATRPTNADLLRELVAPQDPLLGLTSPRDPSALLLNDPLTLANAVAAQRQFELVNAAKESLMNDAYRRGRDEALMNLVNSGRLPNLAPHPTAVASVPVARCEGGALYDQDALNVLGSGTVDRRRSRTPYVDASRLKDPDPIILANRRARGGVTEPFPEKLHRMLHKVEEDGDTAIISFFAHGRAFAVHNPTRFVNEIMPKFFKQSRLSSFQRQLNLYGFTRIIQGPDSGGYYHELFLKGRPNLCVHMRRVGVMQGAAKGGANKLVPNEPNFYSMKPVVEGSVEEERTFSSLR